MPRRGAAAAVRARPLDHPRRAHRRRARRAARSCATQRPQPQRDDKAIASWNGLALAALAEAGRRLDRADWLDAARALGEFLLGPLSRRTGGCTAPGATASRRAPATSRTTRTSRTGSTSCTSQPATCAGCDESRRLALLAVELFADEERGGFFLTPADGEQLVARQKDLDDNPTPSGNSMLAFVLLRLARIWGDDELERRAVGVLRLVRDAIPRAPPAFGWALCALDLHLSPPRELAIVGGPASPVARAALARLRRRTRSSRSGPATACRCSRARTLVDGEPAVYVCERFACRAPVTDPALLADS